MELWFLVNMNISTYQTGSSMIASGLAWWQALIAILVGNAMASGFAVLNSVSGAQSHLGYPIVSRSVWGKSVLWRSPVDVVLRLRSLQACTEPYFPSSTASSSPPSGTESRP